MLELYANIRKLRKEKGWSQAELASRVGYADKSMISRIENGKVDLQLNQIKKFASVLGVSPGELLGRDGIEDDVQLLAVQTADRISEYYRAERPELPEVRHKGKAIIITKNLYSEEEKALIQSFRVADDAIKSAVKKLLDIGGSKA